MSSHFLLLSIWLLFTNYNNNFVQVQEYYMAQNLRENNKFKNYYSMDCKFLK